MPVLFPGPGIPFFALLPQTHFVSLALPKLASMWDPSLLWKAFVLFFVPCVLSSPRVHQNVDLHPSVCIFGPLKCNLRKEEGLSQPSFITRPASHLPQQGQTPCSSQGSWSFLRGHLGQCQPSSVSSSHSRAETQSLSPLGPNLKLAHGWH